MKNYYKILHINPTATTDEIRHAFRVLAHKYHPDKNATQVENADIFIEIKEAYDTLIESNRKKEYDIQFRVFFKIDTNEFEEPKTKKEAIDNKEIIFIFNELNRFRAEKSDEIVLENLKASIDICNRKLTALKNNTAISNFSFIDISSTVVRNGIDISEKIWNFIFDQCFINQLDFFKKAPKDVAISAALSWVESIIDNIITPLENFEMNIYTREQYSIKRQYYLEIKNNFNGQITKKEENKNCYIATMVYGNPNNVNVIILRHYRDNYLNKHFLGRTFVNIYYKISPSMVRHLKHNYIVRNLIRTVLTRHITKLSRGSFPHETSLFDLFRKGKS